MNLHCQIFLFMFISCGLIYRREETVLTNVFVHVGANLIEYFQNR